MAAKMAEYMGAKRGDILPPYARISQLDRKRTALIRYLGLLTCEEMYFGNIFLERSSPLSSILSSSIVCVFLLIWYKDSFTAPDMNFDPKKVGVTESV